VVVTRSRDVVNRWTGRLVAVNLLLLTTGVGVPAVAQAMRMVVQAVSASQATDIRISVE